MVERLQKYNRVVYGDRGANESDALFIKCALYVPTNDFGSRQRYIK